MTSDYRFSLPLVARILGFSFVGLGIAVCALTVFGSVFFDLPGTVLAVVLGGGVLAVAAILVVAFVLVRKSAVVRLGDTGYQVRMIRGASVTRARWKEVEDVVATTVAGERCVVLRLRDGRTTTVPVRALAGDSDALVRDLQAHLNAGHGYRRVR